MKYYLASYFFFFLVTISYSQAKKDTLINKMNFDWSPVFIKTDTMTNSLIQITYLDTNFTFLGSDLISLITGDTINTVRYFNTGLKTIIHYDSSGIVNDVFFVDSSRIVSTQVTFYKSGGIKMIESYKGGHRDEGGQFFFTPDGKLNKILVYEDSILLGAVPMGVYKSLAKKIELSPDSLEILRKLATVKFYNRILNNEFKEKSKITLELITSRKHKINLYKKKSITTKLKKDLVINDSIWYQKNDRIKLNLNFDEKTSKLYYFLDMNNFNYRIEDDIDLTQSILINPRLISKKNKIFLRKEAIFEVSFFYD